MISDDLTPLSFKHAEWVRESRDDAFSPSPFAPLPMTIVFTAKSNSRCNSLRKSGHEISKYRIEHHPVEGLDFCGGVGQGRSQLGKSLWTFSFMLKVTRTKEFKILLRRIPCICINSAKCGVICKCLPAHSSYSRLSASRPGKQPAHFQYAIRSFTKGNSKIQKKRPIKQYRRLGPSRRLRLCRTGATASLARRVAMMPSAFNFQPRTA